MSAHDRIAVLLGALDRPVEPPAAFADALLEQLLGELGDGRARARRRWLRLPSLVPARPASRLRLALVVLVILLLLAGIATGTYFGVKSWVSSAPRGPQFTSDFTFTEIFREEPPAGAEIFWETFQLSRAEDAIYALRHESYPSGPPTLVRLPGVADGTAIQGEPGLDLQELAARPELWDPGTDLADAVVFEYPRVRRTEGEISRLAAAENGDVFLLVGAWPKDEEDPLTPPLSASLVVLHPDASIGRVLTLGEFIGEVGLEADHPEATELSIAASAPGRIRLLARAYMEPVDAGFGVFSFYEVVDPNGDGDWSDREIRPFAVPDEIPLAERAPGGWTQTWIQQIVAEPTVGSEGEAPSLLVTSWGFAGTYQIYRLSDRNGDADALDQGELETVLTVSPGFGDFLPPTIASRVVVEGDEVVSREIIAARLTRQSRISRIRESGEIVDIGRAFNHLEYVLAGPEGNIYVADQLSEIGETCCTWTVSRLAPLEPGEAPSPAPPAASAEAPPPPPAAEPVAPVGEGPSASAAGEPPAEVPELAFTITDFVKGRIVLLGADGSGPRQLAEGEYNHWFCQSADGSQMTYLSDEEAANEQFVYVANANGSEPRKITEEPVSPLCLFSERWLVLIRWSGSGESATLVRHDLESGEETAFADDVSYFAPSPDGNRILFVDGLDFKGRKPAGKASLELIDLETLEQHRLDGPLAEGRHWGLRWSEDGNRVAYAVAPAADFPPPGPSRWDIYVQDVDGGVPRQLASVKGGWPELLLSPDGERLLVCVGGFEGNQQQHGCDGGLPDVPPGELLLADLATGRVSQVAKGEIFFAGWVPGSADFAYATDEALFVVSPDGVQRELGPAPKLGWPAGYWTGFSPDGRYIALGDFNPVVAVFEVETGKTRVLYEESEPQYVEYRRWWR